MSEMNDAMKAVASAPPDPTRSLDYLDGEWQVDPGGEQRVYWIGTAKLDDSVSFEELEALVRELGAELHLLPGDNQRFELHGDVALIDRARRRVDRYLEHVRSGKPV